MEYPVTMRHLMNHTAGFAQLSIADSIKEQTITGQSLEAALLDYYPGQINEPGLVSSYSNYGASLAGYVIESIAGIDFHDYIQLNILDILRMNHTTKGIYDNTTQFFDLKATGYSKTGDELVEDYWTHFSLYPAGYLNGTSTDAAQLMMALMPREGEISPLFINNEILDTMLSPSYDKGKQGTNHGFLSYEFGLKSTMGHTGNLPGSQTIFVISPEESFGVVILTNVGAMELIPELTSLLFTPPEQSSRIRDLTPTMAVDGKYLLMQAIPAKRNILWTLLSANMESVDIHMEEAGLLKLTAMGTEGYYEQIAPGKFVVTNNSNAGPFKLMMPRFMIDSKDGSSTHIQFGNGMDLMRFDAYANPLLLDASIMVLVIGLVYFTIGSIIALVISVINRKRSFERNKQLTKGQRFIFIGGLGLFISAVANTAASIIAAISGISLVLVVAGYLFIALSVWGMYLGFKSYNHQTTLKSQKITLIITAVIFVLSVTAVVFWNMLLLA